MKNSYDCLWDPAMEPAAPMAWRKPRRVRVHLDFADFAATDRVFSVMALTPHHTYQILAAGARMSEYFAEMNPDYLGADSDDVAGCDIAYRLQAGAGTLLDGPWIWGPGRRHRSRIDGFITDCAGRVDGFDEDDPDREFRPVRWPLPNVGIGAEITDQASADWVVPTLLQCPAAWRWLRCELRGAVDLQRVVLKPSDAPERSKPPVSIDVLQGWHGGHGDGRSAITWIELAGGEAPLHPDWARQLRDQCQAAGVPFWFTGWGEWIPVHQGGSRRFQHVLAHQRKYGVTFEGEKVHRFKVNDEDILPVGAHASGRLLDGREHDGLPATTRSNGE